MTRKSLVILLLTCGISAFLFAAALSLSGQGGSSSWDDPDLPPPDARGAAVDKEAYLRARAEYVAEKRGLLGGNFDPTARSRAINIMEAQQLDLYSVLR